MERIQWGLKTLNASGDQCTIDAEIIHGIRVSFKHLKSLLLLGHCCHHSFDRHMIQPLLPLYSIAGIIRNAQLSLALYDHYHLNCPAFLLNQKELILQHTMQLMSDSAGYLKKIHSIESASRHAFKDIPNSKITSCFRSKQNTLHFLLALPEDIDLWHEARKIMKQLLFTNHYLPSALKKQLQLPQENYHTLEQEIGDLHDLVIFRQQFHEQCPLENFMSAPGIENAEGLLKKSIVHHLQNLRKLNSSKDSGGLIPFFVISRRADFGHVL